MPSLLQAIWRSFGWGGRQLKMSPRNVIFITGCDSGLGHSLALFCHSLNMTVVSACHNENSQGAQLLKNCSEANRMLVIELDLLNQQTIREAHKYLKTFLSTHDKYELTALVNNVGVMCFGEFEWQTREQFETQIRINLLGNMSLTKELLPMIRQHKGRIINITSHCGLQALPALSPYAASKAGLRFWNDTLRVEMQQYGVEVVNFIPGSFVMSSNIAARQQQHASQMLAAFDEEQRRFYQNYFTRFNSYLQVISGYKPANMLQDEQLLIKFQHALSHTQPKALYIHEPWRYKFYRILFSICPTPIVDWLTVKFCAMPSFESSKL